MRTYTVTNSGVTAGILVQKEPFPHCRVGEGGRGARFTRVPFGRSDFAGSDVVERCHPITTKEKQTLLLVKEQRRDDKRALVLIQVRGGERGSAYIRSEDGHLLSEMSDEDRNAYGVRLLAVGHSSDGEMGRAGGPHHQALIVLNEGACVQVERKGRVQDGTTKHWVRWLPEEGILTGTLPDVFPGEHAEAI